MCTPWGNSTTTSQVYDLLAFGAEPLLATTIMLRPD